MNRRPALWLLGCVALATARGSDDVFFADKVRPLLEKRCFECHSHGKKIKGGLALDSRSGWKTGGDSGPALVPGKPDESLLIQSVRYEDKDLKMPPKNRLSAEEIAVLEEWVQRGAPDPRGDSIAAKDAGVDFEAGRKWWAFQPVHPLPPPPVQQIAWPKSPADHFVLAKLEANGLAPAANADRRTLIRRLKFALLGLPPTPAETQAFIDDADPHAGERLVDRYLAAPQFGEHWARHWMDVVHYGETHGSEEDALIPFAWRYRDYLVRAFNTDVPYDRFVREHLAGDLLPDPRWHEGRNESRIGPAFWRFVDFYHTPVDVKREEAVVIDQQIDTFGKTFQALTISCARCHDHKFDPISDEDFYALYGILRSAPPAMVSLEEPAAFIRENAALEALKPQAPALLAAHWRRQFDVWPERLRTAAQLVTAQPQPTDPKKKPADQLPSEPWQRALASAAWDRAPQLFSALVPLLKAADQPEEFRRLWREAAARQKPGPLPSEARVFADFRHGQLGPWRADGPGLPAHPQPAGHFSLATTGSSLLRAIRPAGYSSDLLSDRHSGVLSSPEFTIEHDAISFLVSGHGNARLRLVIENFQSDNVLFAMNPGLDHPASRWVTMRMREQWRGRRAHIEVITRDDRTYPGKVTKAETLLHSDGRSAFHLAQVLFHGREWKPSLTLLPADFWTGEASSWEDVATRLRDATESALEAWTADRCDDSQAQFLGEMTAAGLLESTTANAPALADLAQRYREIESRIPIATRVPGVREIGLGADAEFHPRGNHLKPGAPVPRRFLQVLDSDAARYASTDSGRLPLAEEIASPANPLTARVIVNRVWHWLFGTGLVASVDNFGKLGDPPSHPELLDHLTAEFVADGWSVKRLIRRLVLTRAWQMSSEPSLLTLERDPENRLLQHFSVRRLEAEEIRDAMLAVAGNLNGETGGASVRLHYRTAVDPDKQPPSGPLDGDGRRSLYLEMRRNFPSDFLAAFDQPKPVITTGRRSRTNVPAQSLALLNDPFVLHQASVWAARAVRESADEDARLQAMFEEAFARPPAPDEAQRLLALLPADLAARHTAAAWTPLAHVLLNLKEFIYLR